MLTEASRECWDNTVEYLIVSIILLKVAAMVIFGSLFAKDGELSDSKTVSLTGVHCRRVTCKGSSGCGPWLGDFGASTDISGTGSRVVKVSGRFSWVLDCCFSGKYFDFISAYSGVLTTLPLIFSFLNGIFFSTFDFSVAFRALGFFTLAGAGTVTLEARLFFVAGGGNSIFLGSSGVSQIDVFSTFPSLPCVSLVFTASAFALSAKALNMTLGEGGSGDDISRLSSFLVVIGAGERWGSAGDERRSMISLTGTGSLAGIVTVSRVDRSSDGRISDSHLYECMGVVFEERRFKRRRVVPMLLLW